VNGALYGTIWLALAALAAAELGRRARARWARHAWTLGAALTTAHMLLALGLRHGWSQAAARADIAQKTAAVFGWAWEGGLVVNYAFGALLWAEAAWWHLDPAGLERRPRALTALVRGFILLIAVNGAIVFASPLGRVAGVPLVAALLWAWRPDGATDGAPRSGPLAGKR